MPLEKSKSKAAFNHNVKKEIEAGKPAKQAVAIAYSEKRAAKKRGTSDGYMTKMREANKKTHEMLTKKSKVKAHSEKLKDYVG